MEVEEEGVVVEGVGEGKEEEEASRSRAHLRARTKPALLLERDAWRGGGALEGQVWGGGCHALGEGGGLHSECLGMCGEEISQSAGKTCAVQRVKRVMAAVREMRVM